MPGSERSLLRIIVKGFINSLKPNFPRRKMVGEDYFGTKYYEIPVASHSTRKKASRYFEPVTKEKFDQEIPPEWESWLRYRRQDPPSREEIEANYKLAMSKKKLAAKLEERRKNETPQIPAIPKNKKGHESFPVYKEYENYGKDYTPKLK